jgi:hypothetical protein
VRVKRAIIDVSETLSVRTFSKLGELKCCRRGSYRYPNDAG